jgi:hypothetical protein
VRVEYLSENKFNVFKGEESTGDKLELILADAEVVENPESNGEIIIRTKDEQFKVNYINDSHNDVLYCLDNEGAPLALVIT